MVRRAIAKIVRQYAMRRDPIAFARSIGVTVGERCRFLDVTEKTFGSEPYLVFIGDHVTITSGVTFITHDGGVWVFREADPDIDVFRPVTVGNNVFIGINAIIMPGVTVGDNAIIGAGSVVVKNVPSDTVVAGVPARPIRPIAEYRERLEGAVTRTRSLPPHEKEAFLRSRFPGRLGPK